ncbi:DNA/RNA helicase domain-containing protein [Aquitalea denitrificans]|uniref:DNA/RNA helicase domain-containing protein n=1 Tax=Aquitalea denitrificans TaxID=519081 RepID=UPI0013591F25|nr:DNA/RNA helicase domain-containing protein [Aquitalea denitrificans]
MAVMIPALQPQETESPGEPTVYSLLEKGLSSEFTVIHSLPWLCSKIRNIDKKFAPTGEIDFLVIHPDLGVLALEIKSGHYRIDGVTFVRKVPGASKNPVSQIRRNVHGLTNWLGADPDLHIRFGYGFVFPDSRFGDVVISPALIDVSIDPPQRIFVDQEQMPNLASRVREMLAYWNSAGGTHRLGKEKTRRLIDTLCPKYDGTPSWGMRVMYDNHLWLRLTREQSEVLNKASAAQRMVITGWPGTGKTLIGSELAGRAANSGKRVLFITYNNLLRDALQSQLSFCERNCDVMTWHGLCGEARRRIECPPESSDNWLSTTCLDDLRAAIEANAMQDYDLLVLDEAQALRLEWVQTLEAWFKGKRIIAFCDETQVFKFEQETANLEQLSQAIGTTPFNLTMVLRMPKAVTERLLAYRPPNFQLLTPRPYNPDALQERVIPNWSEALSAVLDELITQDLQGRDVVVLTRFPPNQSSPKLAEIISRAGVRHESIARFRGVESPAVIVLGGDEMDDVELFCAYSRATTVCVALYKAEDLAWKASGSFHQLLLKNEHICALTQEAKHQSLTSTLMANHMGNSIRGVETIRLAWSSAWHTWLVELKENCDPGETWIDYLVTEYPWPVLYWYADARRRIYLASPLDGLDNDIEVRSFQPMLCPVCRQQSPYESQSDQCIFCVGRLTIDATEPSPKEFSKIADQDATIRRLANGDAEGSSISNLPVPLIAVGARLYGQAHRRRNTVPKEELPSRNVLYRIALAFIYSRVDFLRQGVSLSRVVLTDKLYGNYESLQAVPFKRWEMWMASAFSTCSHSKKLLIRVQKGIFVPADDEQVEPPTR